MRVNHHFQLTLLAAALLSVHASAALAAGDEETTQYTKPVSSISIGIGSWSDNRMHEGMYDGMWEDGLHGSIDANVQKRDDATGTWTRLRAQNLGLDTVELGGSYERQGNWGVGIEYSQTPRQNPVVVNTALQGIGTETQTVTAVTNAATTRDNARDVLMDVQRDATSLNFFKRFSPNLEVRVGFKNEEKNGDRQYGVRTYPTWASTSGSYPAFVAEPIDSTTRQLDAVLNYTSEKLQLSGGYYGSWYNNHNTRLDVIGTAGGVTEMSLPPDNQAHQGYVQGNYAFTPATLGMFKIAYTHATQDQSFMSTSNNGLAAWAPLATAGSSLQGEVNTAEAMLGLTARPMPKLSLLANLRYWDRQDDTPVRVDAGTTPQYHNNPFQNTKTSGKVEGTYRFQDGYSATAGVDYVHQKRDISNLIDTEAEIFSPYRSTVNELTYKLVGRRNLSETLNGSIEYTHSKRDGSAYSDAEANFAEITPIHIADRNRDKLKVVMDWNPLQSFGLQFSYANARDKYPTDIDHQAGIRKGSAQFWSFDANYALNDSWQLNAWFSRDITKVDQTGYVEHADPDNVPSYADLSDKANSFGLGVKGKVTSRLDVGMSFDWVRSRADFTQTTNAVNSSGTPALQSDTVQPLPSIENKITRLNLYGNYMINKNSSIRADLIREHWRTDDWTWAFSDGSPYTYLTEGTMVISDPKQSATFVGVRYTYKFQ